MSASSSASAWIVSFVVDRSASANTRPPRRHCVGATPPVFNVDPPAHEQNPFRRTFHEGGPAQWPVGENRHVAVATIERNRAQARCSVIPPTLPAKALAGSDTAPLGSTSKPCHSPLRVRSKGINSSCQNSNQNRCSWTAARRSWKSRVSHAKLVAAERSKKTAAVIRTRIANSPHRRSQRLSYLYAVIRGRVDGAGQMRIQLFS